MLKDVPRRIHERTFRRLANIPANFRKNQIDPDDIFKGLGKDDPKKLEVKNHVTLSL